MNDGYSYQARDSGQFVPKDRLKVLRGKQSWNARQPEHLRRTDEEIEAEVDRIIADDRANGERRFQLHLERSRAWWKVERARLIGIGDDACRELGHALERAEGFYAALEAVRFYSLRIEYCQWLAPRYKETAREYEGGDLAYQASLIIGWHPENLTYYPSYLAELRDAEDDKGAGLLSIAEYEKAARLARARFVGRLRTGGMGDWADAIETGNYRLILRGFPLIRQDALPEEMKAINPPGRNDR